MPTWIKCSDKLPEEKKQIVTKDDLGNYSVNTLMGGVWKYQGEKYWERYERPVTEWLSDESVQVVSPDEQGEQESCTCDDYSQAAHGQCGSCPIPRDKYLRVRGYIQ